MSDERADARNDADTGDAPREEAEARGSMSPEVGASVGRGWLLAAFLMALGGAYSLATGLFHWWAGGELTQPLRYAVFVGGGFVLSAGILVWDVLLDALRRRGPRTALLVGLNVALAVAVAGTAVFLSHQKWLRWDLTDTGMWTIAEESRHMVDAMETPIVFQLLSRPSDLRARTETLLEAYRTVAPDKVTVEVLDPDRSPERTNALLQEHGLDLRWESFHLVVRAGEDVQLLGGMDMEEAPGPMTGATEAVFKGEQAVTGALKKLAEPGEYVVGFLGGLETLVSALGAGDTDLAGRDVLSRFPELLRREGITVRNVSLRRGELGDDISALVVAGPQADLSPGEREVLHRWLLDGGRMLLCIDWTGYRGEVPLEVPEWIGLCADFGIEVTDLGVVQDTSRGVLPVAQPLIDPARRAPVLRGLGGRHTAFYLAREVRESPEGGPGGRFAETLLRGGESMVALTADELDAAFPSTPGASQELPEDPPREVSIAALWEGEASDDARPGRLVVVGDSDWLRDPGHPASTFAVGVNSDLARNMVNWLLERETLLTIGTRSAEDTSLVFSDDGAEQNDAVTFWGVMFVANLPILALLCAGLVWFVRRTA